MKDSNKIKKIHIGNDVWKCGAISTKLNPLTTDNDKYRWVKHVVIYGPNKQLYHLYNENVDMIDGGWDQSRKTNRNGNTICESKLKIYSLTRILDTKSNWCFDLSIIPDTTKLKVIYDNGTIKNIEFNGEFEDVAVKKNYPHTWKNIIHNCFIDKNIKPIGYRIPKYLVK
jgi:hypothetical protein